MFTIAPPPCSRISRAAAWQHRNVPVRFTRRTCSHSASVTSSGSLRWIVPAAFTRMSSRPRSAATPWNVAAIEAGSATSRRSPEWPAPMPESSATVSATFASAREPTITDAPACANPTAMARPNPLVPPVTSATRPVRSNPE